MLFLLFHQSCDEALTWRYFLEIFEFSFPLSIKKIPFSPIRKLWISVLIPFRLSVIFSSQNHQSYSISSPTHSTRRRHHRRVQSYHVDITILLSTPTSALFYAPSTSSSYCRRRSLLSSSFFCLLILIFCSSVLL